MGTQPGTVVGRNHDIGAIKHEYRPRGLRWALEEGKGTVLDWTGQEKSQKGYISHIWTEAPTEAIYIKNCVVSDVFGVIMCAKFQSEIFRGYDFTGGGRIFHFPINFSSGVLKTLPVKRTGAHAMTTFLAHYVNSYTFPVVRFDICLKCVLCLYV